jgi:3'-5' exoribonuclease
MAKAKPTTVRLCDMKSGQSGDFFAQLSERVRGARKDGKPFYTCRFSDPDRVAVAMIWSDGPWFEVCDADWRVGDFYKVRATYAEHPTYGPQLDIVNIRRTNDADAADGFDPLQYVPRTPFDVEAMYQELWMLAESAINDLPLRRLVLTLLTKTCKQLKRVPASKKHFFPYAGGLLEHTLSVTHSCMHLVDKYVNHYPDLKPPINRDIVVAAAILHDLGRTAEFADEGVSFDKTVVGELVGHIILGRDLIRDTAKELGDIDPKLQTLLEHVVLSHLELPAWGSPRLPLVPEAIILHHADDLDAKLDMYVRCLARDKEPGPFTARDPVLGKSLYKER